MASNVIFTVEGKGKNLKKTSKEVNDLGRGAERAGKGLDGAGKLKIDIIVAQKELRVLLLT